MTQVTSPLGLDLLSNSHHLPISVDTMSFDDRHERFVRDFRRKMLDDELSSSSNSEMRRREFQNDFDRMSRDFVHLRPRSAGGASTTSSRLSRGGGQVELGGSRESLDEDAASRLIVDTGSGTRKFHISFDVKEYRPDDISIKIKDNSILVVEARHEEVTDGNRRSREFSRTVRLPADVNVDRLTSVLSRDGILTVQAPLPPRYVTTTGGVRVQAGYSSNDMHSAPVSPKSYCSSMMGTVEKYQLSPSFSEVSTSSTFIPPNPIITTLPTTLSSSLDSGYCGSTGMADQVQFPTYTTMSAGGQKMELIVDVGRLFCSEDIVVRVDGPKLIVEARRELQQQQASRPEKCRLFVSREYELSCLMEPSSIEAALNANGKLRVTARVESASNI